MEGRGNWLDLTFEKYIGFVLSFFVCLFFVFFSYSVNH